MAISLEMPESYFMSHSEEIDFSTAAHFTQLFGRVLLESKVPSDVDVLKVDIPSDATQDTPWRVTRLSRAKYYIPVAARREHLAPIRSVAGRSLRCSFWAVWGAEGIPQ